MYISNNSKENTFDRKRVCLDVFPGQAFFFCCCCCSNFNAHWQSHTSLSPLPLWFFLLSVVFFFVFYCLANAQNTRAYSVAYALRHDSAAHRTHINTQKVCTCRWSVSVRFVFFFSSSVTLTFFFFFRCCCFLLFSLASFFFLHLRGKGGAGVTSRVELQNLLLLIATIKRNKEPLLLDSLAYITLFVSSSFYCLKGSVFSDDRRLFYFYFFFFDLPLESYLASFFVWSTKEKKEIPELTKSTQSTTTVWKWSSFFFLFCFVLFCFVLFVAYTAKFE